ncbi:MAG: hypothetical protein A2X46_04285 [Lentisphaerae bacterium GWF2_57_35]|nr:MAG: hypothetical protein A2X46_04285 [Lentisphaerae bacterium GWF2_57_35]
MSNVISIIKDELVRLPADRLFFRIACRTAEWPVSLEGELKRRWGEDNFSAYELAPLRKADVCKAAEANGINPDTFVDEIRRLRVQALAIKPATLSFLLNIQNAKGHLPATEAEAYEQGCVLLCEESLERQEARIHGKLSAKQRFSIAKRIAAVTIFSNKFAVWTGPNDGTAHEADIPLSDLVFGEEIAEQSFTLNENAVRETINTGLFTSRGVHRMGWAHQTYAEYLAAAYLLDHGVSDSKILSIITDHYDGSIKVVPQLNEIAARLASSKPSVFDQIVHTDPLVLLRSDVANSDDDKRRNLVRSLLRLANEGKLHFRMMTYWERFALLKYDNMAEDLRPYIAEPSVNLFARYLALILVESCAVPGLVPELVSVAFDTRANEELRCNAIDAISKTGTDEDKRLLRPLAEISSEDKRFRIRGHALEVLWPDFISVEETLSLIESTPPETVIGSYQMFISHELAPRLQLQHLETALSWAANLPNLHDRTHTFSSLVDGILVAAWNNMDQPKVVNGMARCICEIVKKNYGLRIESSHLDGVAFLDDDEKRRKLINAIVPLIENPKNESSYLCRGSATRVIDEKDFPWLLQNLLEAKNPKESMTWGYLCQRMFRFNDVNQSSMLLTHSLNEHVDAFFGEWIKPLAVDSEAAKALKNEYERDRQLSITDDGPTELEPTPSERIQILLNRCENSEPGLWWCIARELTLAPTSTADGDTWEPDLTAQPGWQTASNDVRQRIIKTASLYISQCNDRKDEWIAKSNLFFLPANAGYQALRLLFQFQPSVIDALDTTIWAKWSAAILDYPRNLSTEEAERYHSKLIRVAYQKSPEVLRNALEEICQREDREGHAVLTPLNHIKHIVNADMAAILRRWVHDRLFSPTATGHIISVLAELNDPNITALALQFIHPSVPVDEPKRSYAISAIHAISSILDHASWPIVWNAILTDRAFGQSLIGCWANRHLTGSCLTRLDDNQLKDLYLWVTTQYPHAEDPHVEEVHMIEDREQVAHWRDQDLLGLLTNRATFSACAAIKQICDSLPAIDWLNYYYCQAIVKMRSERWNPLGPKALIKLIKQENSRVISDGHQLLHLIIESLDRLNQRLHGAPPAIVDIWDQNRESSAWTPLDENSLSDYLSRFFTSDIAERGVVVNREVQIRPRVIEAGQRTDIHVNAIGDDNKGIRDIITCIIEVKGCWNPELDDAMQSQLVERYLQNNACHHGLYLVGWFQCEAWDNKDHRKKQSPAKNLVEARIQFQKQAEALTSRGIVVRSYVLDCRLG